MDFPSQTAESIAGGTLAGRFLQHVVQQPDRTAVRFRRTDGLVHRSWRELADDVCRLTAGLASCGVERGDRVAQLAENRYEWLVTDLAIHLLGGVHVPIHSSLAAPQVTYQIIHSGAQVVLASNTTQCEKLAREGSSWAAGRTLIHYDPCAIPIPDAARCVSLHDCLSPCDPQVGWQMGVALANAADTSALATILYTSGTTGQPKGVMLTQANLFTNAMSTIAAFQLNTDDRRLCFLPLSHIFARTCDLYTWLCSGYQLDLATSRESVIDDLQWSQPTVINGVPYFYERLQRHLQTLGQANTPGSLRALLGGKIQYCCGGGAALPNPIFDYFWSQGVPLLQGYGLTETSPVASLSTLTAYRRGSSGRPLRDVEVATTEEGEIITRGPHVMKGYWKDPEATAAVLRDGWFHTGDLGHVDDDQFVFITGRKKELIVTAAGKNIAPVLLESLLTGDRCIDQALIIGDGRNYLTALIIVNWPAFWEESSLRECDFEHLDVPQRIGHPQVRQYMELVIARQLEGVSYHEQVRKFTILPQPFSIEAGELTAKLSLRRPILMERYRDVIEAMYGATSTNRDTSH